MTDQRPAAERGEGGSTTGHGDRETTGHVSRRTFVKGVGVTAGAAALGVGATGGAAAVPTVDGSVANPRVREAAKVWESKPWRPGFRGRPDRTVALNDSGIDLDHPDLGPWNGVTAVTEATDASDRVPAVRLSSPENLAARAESRGPVGEGESQTAILGPGTTVEGTETTFPPFEVPEGEGIVELDAELHWTPQNVALPATVVVSEAGEDQSFSVQLNVGEGDEDEWVTLQTIDTGANPETLSGVTVVPGEEHRFVAGQFANVVAEGEVTWQYYTYGEELTTVPESEVFGSLDENPTPKTLGWYDAGGRYGDLDAPEDPDSHGSHVSSIMVGSGRASTVDPDRYTEDAPHAVLAAGDVLTYEVEADPGTGVFGVATGTGIEVLVEGPGGRTLRSSGVAPLVGGDKEALPIDDARVDHPTVDERHPVVGGEREPATYTVVVRPSSGELAATGRVEEVAVGAFAPAARGDGSRTGDDVGVHAGVAPDQGLVGLQGLSGPAAALGLYADQMGPAFNVRAVNMSWGGLVPGGGSIGGSGEERAIKSIAEGGILTVAAAGNTFGSPTGAPGIADEAVAVASTNYVDGITVYTDGGAVAQDEDGEEAYGKPDVCAPGGSYEAGARAARAGSDGVPAGVDGVRDYVNFPGTSMASPYVCGVAALVAQAMEESAPDALALPAPKDLHANYTAEERLEHVLRLKSVLLSTASSTAFTAAPYHRHPVAYRHDGRDTYEGFGRVNPDAAVDAVTRDLFADATADGDATSATVSGTVGLDVPDDARAIAGYVEVPAGTLDVSLAHGHYAGGNKGMAEDVPWLDLFVYDAASPGRAGEPNTLASAMGQEGVASVSLDVPAARDDPATDPDESETRTLFVVAKLVNVPGVVNGYDVRSHVDVDLTFTPSGDLPLPAFSASGSRSDDGSAFTAGQTNHVEVTVESFSDGVTAVSVADRVPDGWTVLDGGDVTDTAGVDGGTRVDLGTVTRDDLGSEAATREYFVEATGDTGEYEFGEAAATVAATESGISFSEDRSTFGGTDRNAVVGVEQPGL